MPDKLRVREALDLYASFYDNPASVQALLDEVGLDPNVAFAKLSGGQRQRLSIALALVGNPRIAILDELTTGLDPQARRETWDLITRIRDRGVTVLLVTHFMEEVERLCDRVAVISRRHRPHRRHPGRADLARSGGMQRITFRSTVPVESLKDLPEVHSVTVEAGQVTVTGDDNVLRAVVTALPAAAVSNIKTETSTMDDAFLALTGE